MINQAIHTLDLLQWFLGKVTQFQGGVSQRLLGGDMEVEDAVDLVLDHFPEPAASCSPPRPTWWTHRSR
jgi:predicted dehydrogenase